ncbi:MAG TPA: tetratricopeptide repeat protein [Chlamydiales bacterium]|nr:tetratricopeptide repeat protein [Chlamydiales bacterium]
MSLTPTSNSRYFFTPPSTERGQSAGRAKAASAAAFAANAFPGQDGITPKIGSPVSSNAARMSNSVSRLNSKEGDVSPKITGERNKYLSPTKAKGETPKQSSEQHAYLQMSNSVSRLNSKEGEVSPKITGDRNNYPSPTIASSETPKLTSEQHVVLQNADQYLKAAENYRSENRTSDAMKALVERVNLLKESMPESLYLAAAYTDLATAREKNGELDKAITCLERALPIQEKHLAGTPELFRSYGYLALLYTTLDKIDLALEYYEKGKGMLKHTEVLASEVAAVNDKIANLLEAKGDQTGRALQLRMSNIRAYEEFYPNTMLLADYYDLIASYNKDESLLKKSSEIEKRLGFNCQEFAAKIGKMYEDRHRLEQTFSQITKNLSSEHSSTDSIISQATSYTTKAGIRRSLLRSVDCVGRFEWVLQKKAALDPQNLFVASQCEIVGDQYIAQENEKLAKIFYYLALKIRANVLGKDHRDVLNLSEKANAMPGKLISMSQARMGSVTRAQSVVPQEDAISKLCADLAKYDSTNLFGKKNAVKDKARDDLMAFLDQYRKTKDDTLYKKIAKFVNDELIKPNNPAFDGKYSGNLSALFVRASGLFKVY